VNVKVRHSGIPIVPLVPLITRIALQTLFLAGAIFAGLHFVQAQQVDLQINSVNGVNTSAIEIDYTTGASPNFSFGDFNDAPFLQAPAPAFNIYTITPQGQKLGLNETDPAYTTDLVINGTGLTQPYSTTIIPSMWDYYSEGLISEDQYVQLILTDPSHSENNGTYNLTELSATSGSIPITIYSTGSIYGEIAVVPEPGTVVSLSGLGIIGGGAYLWKRRKRKKKRLASEMTNAPATPTERSPDDDDFDYNNGLENW